MIVYYVAIVLRRAAGLRAQPLQVRRQHPVHVLRHERLRPLPAAAARVPGATTAPGPLLLVVLAYLFWVRGTTERLAQPARGGARARRRSPCSRTAGVGALAIAAPRRLHLLQHQRPQPLPHANDAMQAQRRLREEVQAARERAAAARSSPWTWPSTSIRRAAGADARHLTLVNKNAVPVDRRAPVFVAGERLDGATSWRSPAAPTLGTVDERIGVRSYSWRRRSRPARSRARLRPRAARRTASPTRAPTPTSSTTAPSSTATSCCP